MSYSNPPLAGVSSACSVTMLCISRLALCSAFQLLSSPPVHIYSFSCHRRPLGACQQRTPCILRQEEEGIARGTHITTSQRSLFLHAASWLLSWRFVPARLFLQLEWALEDTIEQVRERNLPLIIDGSGLNFIATRLHLVKGYSNCILTPNIAEFGRLAQGAGVPLEGPMGTQWQKHVSDACY